MSAPTILLLHAFPVDARMWAPQVAALDLVGYESMAPTFPGREPDNELSSWASRILELYSGDFVPIGCSMGGYLVFELWRQAPARIPAAVFIDTRVGPDSPEAREGRAETIRLLSKDGFDAFWQVQSSKLFSPEAPLEVVAKAREMAAEQSIENLVATVQAIAGRPDSGETASTMKIPTLVIVGEEDAITPPIESEELVAILPETQLVRLPGAGHLAPLERPAQVSEELVLFLTRVAPPAV